MPEFSLKLRAKAQIFFDPTISDYSQAINESGSLSFNYVVITTRRDDVLIKPEVSIK